MALHADRALAAWNAQGPGSGPSPNVTLAAASGTGAALGAPVRFDAGGFSQTSPLPAFAGAVPLILFTRQLPEGSGLRNEVAAADPVTGDAIALGTTRSIAPPAVAHIASGLLVAWPATTGGVAVTVHP